MSEETTAIIIKPEAIAHGPDIIGMFERKGLRIVGDREFEFTDEKLRKLYGSHPPEVQKRLWEQMLGKTGIMVKISGENAIAEVVTISGESYDPKLCAKGTVRHRFGSKERGREHYNAVHRGKTPEEVMITLELIEW